MACTPVQKLCPNLRISQSVTYASGVVTVNIPAGDYENGKVYGIVIAQNIPTDAIIGAPVIITIGGGTVQYPLLKCNGAPATVYNIDKRTKYLCRVVTSASGGSFRMLGRSCCSHSDALSSINGTAPTT